MPNPTWLSDPLFREALQLVQVAHPDIDHIRLVIDTVLSRFDTSEAANENRLIDRIKNERKPTKNCLLGPPFLHLLIMMTSDEIAEARELARPLSRSKHRMTARYLQHVAILGVAHWSRWLAIGLCQLVYTYSGTDVDRLLGTVGVRYYDQSKRKGNKRTVMARLSDRFGDLIVVQEKSENVHFTPLKCPERCHDLVVRSLRLFTPWDPQTWAGREWMQSVAALRPDWQELQRCRSLIDPDSFGRLVAKHGLRPPSETLRLPRVMR